MDKKRLDEKKSKRRLTVSLMLVMIILLAATTSASISAFEWLRGNFFSSRMFTLKGVSVYGNSRISSEDILNAANLNVGTDNIHYIMCDIVEKRIKAKSRYIGQVEAERNFVLDRDEGICCLVTITIEEREPAALVHTEEGIDSFVVIDNRGFILEEIKMGPDSYWSSPFGNMPIIVGIGEKCMAGKALRIVDCPALDLAMETLVSAQSIIPELFGKISHIDARDPDSIILLLQEKSSLKGKDGISGTGRSLLQIAIASDRIKEGLGSILPVIAKRKSENKETKFIDARFSGAVYCSERSAFSLDVEGRWKSG